MEVKNEWKGESEIYRFDGDFSGWFVASETGIGKEDVQQKEVPGLESGIIFGSRESWTTALLAWQCN